MTLASPLWALQEALYTRLTGSLTAAAVYDWLPEVPADAYVFMEEETVTGAYDKSGAMQRVNSRLVAFSAQPDREELKGVVNEVFAALGTPLTLTGWKVVQQLYVPDMRTYRATTVTGLQGNAADINYQFLLQQTT